MQIEPGRCENSLRQSVPPAAAGSALCRWLDAGLKASSTLEASSTQNFTTNRVFSLRFVLL
jgi:hypothetical protein